MKRCIWIIGLLLLITSVIGLAGCDLAEPPGKSSTGNSYQTSGIWVTGEGKVTVVPDIAVLNVGVEAQADSVAEAQSQATGAMDAILKELKASGIADKDIKTQYYSIYPSRSWSPDTGEEKLTGYRVTNMVTVKVRTVESTGSIIDAVAKAGGNYVRIDNISFTVDDPVPYQKQAREKALAENREAIYAILASSSLPPEAATPSGGGSAGLLTLGR